MHKILFSQLIFVCNKYLVFIQTCSRIIVDLKKPIWNKNSELCEHITCFFWIDVKFARFSLGSGKLYLSHSFAQ